MKKANTIVIFEKSFYSSLRGLFSRSQPAERAGNLISDKRLLHSVRNDASIFRRTLILIMFAIIGLSVNLQLGKVNAQSCGTGGCTSSSETNQYPSSTFSTSTSTWVTVSAYMNAGNWTLFNVTSGNTHEWTYCPNVEGSQAWDAELTLFNNSSGSTLCYSDNSGLSGCSTAPYISWAATFTGTVRLLTTVSGCTTNTGSPYSTLVWRQVNGTPTVEILGVDVSSYQGASIDWSQVKGAGFIYAFAKATEGVTITDADFQTNMVNGENAGEVMGAYHFAHPEDNTAAAEASYFLSVAGPYIKTCELPPVLDLEGSTLQTDFTSAQLTAWVQEWMTAVQTQTGIAPILYIGASTAAYLNSSLNTYKLWISNPGTSSTTPPTSIGVWTNWAFKQYDWTGTVPGISGISGMDLDVFNGDTAAFYAMIGCPLTGIKEGTTNDNFVIYPNPAINNLTIENQQEAAVGSKQLAIIEIKNIQGQLVKTSTTTGNKTILDVSAFPGGVYIVEVKTSKGIVVRKFVKE
jgi:GH25 family lysozyme M1 (1,4-beta-N-acetylmuramidase)